MLVFDAWRCERPFFQVPKFYGTYPQGFLAKALSEFPNAKDILHCPSGSVAGPGITVDAVRDQYRCPQIVASADAIPLPDNSFDLFLSDPPYKEKDAKKYGCPPFPLGGMMKEAFRLVRPGGYFAMLHLWCPNYSPEHFTLVKQVAIYTGTEQYVRLFSIFKSNKKVD